ncbi:MAG TPA: hypothetical protein ENH41_03860 [Candidatus Omnitrophica bacterium]|nr:hypothetical protein [Candidatus Omnitrophota bacterium]
MKYLIVLIITLSLALSFQSNSYAALCAFRNPDRDTYKLFPRATGYRSVIRTLDAKTKKAMEEFLGQPLDYDEAGEHTFYLVLKGEEVIGIIRPHAERGKYGIVEMVWAFSLDGEIIDFLIQRSRERGTDRLKHDEFRRQFRGKSLNDPFTIGGTKEINTNLIKPPEGVITGPSVIAYSAKKNLFLYKYFFPEYHSISQGNSIK